MPESDSAISAGELILYQTEDGATRIETRVAGDTVWLSLNQMAELFQRDKSVLSRHLRNVFDEGELERDSVVANFATTAADGKQYWVDHYNLDVIISVGFRVKSLRGTQFRIWATQRLREYLVKGFTMDDERLKLNKPLAAEQYSAFRVSRMTRSKATSSEKSGESRNYVGIRSLRGYDSEKKNDTAAKVATAKMLLVAAGNNHCAGAVGGSRVYRPRWWATGYW